MQYYVHTLHALSRIFNYWLVVKQFDDDGRSYISELWHSVDLNSQDCWAGGQTAITHPIQETNQTGIEITSSTLRLTLAPKKRAYEK
jgi:hypothetical protein